MSYELTLNTRRVYAIIVGVAVMLGISLLLTASVKIVDAGHRGVLLHWQEVDGVVCDEQGRCSITKPSLKEGLHFVTPFQDDVVNIQTRTQKFEKQTGAASQDLQGVSTTIAINFHPTPDAIHLLYKTVGPDYIERIITPAVDETVKQITAKYNAEDLIQKREVVKGEIENALGQRLIKFNLIQEVVSITDFQFSPQFAQAIEAKVTTQQQALTAENQIKIRQAEAKQLEAQAMGERLATIQRAEGIKQSAILEAEGHAEAIRINAQAEQDKIRLLTEFLKSNPEYIEWFRLLQWNGHLPENLVLTDDNGIVPLLNIPAKTVKGQ